MMSSALGPARAVLGRTGPVQFVTRSFETNITDVSCDDGLLASCLSWAEAARIGFYREFVRRSGPNREGSGQVPRVNRVHILDRNLPQGAIVTATCWVGVVGKRSYEVHCALECEGKVFARVETVRVHIGELRAEDNLILLDMLQSTKEIERIPPHTDSVENTDLVKIVTTRTQRSDCDALGHVNMSYYPFLLMTAFWSNDNEPVPVVSKFEVDYKREILPNTDIDLEVRQTSNRQVVYVLIKDSLSKKILTQSRFEFALDVRARYGWETLPRTSKSLRQLAFSQMDERGAFRTSHLVCFEHTSTASAFMQTIIKWTEMSLFPVMQQLIAKKPPHSTGGYGKTYTSMTRAIRAYILKRPEVSNVILADCFIGRFGKSSIEFFVRFRDAQSKEDLFFSSLTKVQVDLVKRKASEMLFFDTTHFQKLYQGLKPLPVPPAPVFDMQPLLKVFTFTPVLRHQYYNLDRHMTSHNYVFFVNNAYDAWQLAKTSSKPSSGTAESIVDRFVNTTSSDSWFSTYGCEYMHEIMIGEPLEINIYSDGSKTLWFTFDVNGITKCRVWTVSRDLPSFNWLVLTQPHFYLKPHSIEGIDSSKWGAVVDDIKSLPASL